VGAALPRPCHDQCGRWSRRSRPYSGVRNRKCGHVARHKRNINGGAMRRNRKRFNPRALKLGHGADEVVRHPKVGSVKGQAQWVGADRISAGADTGAVAGPQRGHIVASASANVVRTICAERIFIFLNPSWHTRQHCYLQSQSAERSKRSSCSSRAGIEWVVTRRCCFARLRRQIFWIPAS